MTDNTTNAKLYEKMSFSAGVIYGIFFYIKFKYHTWDAIVLWVGNTFLLLGLYLAWRQNK